MAGIRMLLAGVLAAGTGAAWADQPAAQDPQPRWQVLPLAHADATAAKRAALEQRRVARQAVPPADPLVAEIGPDGRIVIRHRRPQAPQPADGERREQPR